MARTLIRQGTQVRESDVYDDTTPPSSAAYETNAAGLEDNLNHLRSQVQNFLNRNGAGFPAGNWFDDLTAPSALEPGAQRGINAINDGLHAVEKKRVLLDVHNLTDITVGGDNWVVLDAGAADLPPNTTAAVGAAVTLGTVVAAHGGTFGTHALSEVAGTTAISPKNLCAIFDGSTRDPITSGSRRVWGLLQVESGVVDGSTITATAATRAQISFVRITATGDGLEAVPAVDIQGRVINYCCRERFRLEDLTEDAFLSGAFADVPEDTAVARQVGYDNQGATPVDIVASATLDLEAPGITWSIRDDLEASLLSIVEGSAGGTSEVEVGAAVDIYNNDAALVDFASGATIRSGGAAPIDVGVTDGHVETTAGDLHLQAAAEVFFDDVNQTGSTWAQANGIKLSGSAAEWDAFSAEFGEVSVLSAIAQAALAGLPPPAAEGQVLYSRDGVAFTAETPLTSKSGWLSNDAGQLLVVGDPTVVSAAWTPRILGQMGYWTAGAGHSFADGALMDTLVNQGTEPLLDMSSSGALRPTFRASVAAGNGQPAIEFIGGVNNLHTAGTTAWEAPDGTSFMIWTVMVPSGPSTSIFYSMGEGIRGNILCYSRPVPGNSYDRIRDVNNSNFYNFGGFELAGQLSVVATVWRSQVAPGVDTLERWVNGVLVGSASLSLGNITHHPSLPLTSIVLGGYLPTSGHWRGQTFECGYGHGELSAGADAALTTYLNDKYGLTLPGVSR